MSSRRVIQAEPHAGPFPASQVATSLCLPGPLTPTHLHLAGNTPGEVLLGGGRRTQALKTEVISFRVAEAPRELLGARATVLGRGWQRLGF